MPPPSRGMRMGDQLAICSPCYLPLAYGGGFYNPTYKTGNIGVLLPLVQAISNFIFFNGSMRFDTFNNSSLAAGMGARMISEFSFFGKTVTGVYGHFNYQNPSTNNRFVQINWTFELLSRRMDVRFTAYLATSPSKAIENSRPLERKGIFFPYLYANKGFLYPYEGCSGEFGGGFRFLRELKFYLGGYYLTAGAMEKVKLPSLMGGRFRVNYDFNSYVSFEAKFQYDEVRKLRYSAGFNFRVPLGTSNLEKIHEMQSRMTEQLRWNIDI